MQRRALPKLLGGESCLLQLKRRSSLGLSLHCRSAKLSNYPRCMLLGQLHPDAQRDPFDCGKCTALHLRTEALRSNHLSGEALLLGPAHIPASGPKRPTLSQQKHQAGERAQAKHRKAETAYDILPRETKPCAGSAKLVVSPTKIYEGRLGLPILQFHPTAP